MLFNKKDIFFTKNIFWKFVVTNFNNFMKHLISLTLALALTSAVNAQWIGPTNGTLTTTNRVQLNYTASFGAFNPSNPSPPPPSYFFTINLTMVQAMSLPCALMTITVK